MTDNFAKLMTDTKSLIQKTQVILKISIQNNLYFGISHSKCRKSQAERSHTGKKEYLTYRGARIRIILDYFQKLFK